ncbi:MAG: hypothetical protein JSS11_08910 [Verrucomicrobia bacterium]|nr:hypothetical protein [Verrucomicrobiota bacterium]
MPDLLSLSAAHPIPLPLDDSAADQLPSEFVWMPKGEHQISAYAAGDAQPWVGRVTCDEAGARAVAAAHAKVLASGRRVYLDENHDDAAATAWVLAFSWDPARGIIVKVAWTSLGESLLRGKVYHSFSPAFLINRSTGRVTGFPAGHAAGGLVNAPAFGAAMPALIAARLSGADTLTVNPASGGLPDNPKSTMHKELLLQILAALAVQVPADANDEQLATLFAQHQDQLLAAAQTNAALQAQLAALDVVHAKAGTDAAELTLLRAKDVARRAADAQTAVAAAVARGALPAKDETIQAKWRGLIASDPAHATLLAALPANPALTRVTTPGGDLQVTPKLLEHLRGYAAEKDAKRAGAIYARHIDGEVGKLGNHVLELMASNSLGSSATAIITQRVLTLLKYRFPFLKQITTDFSSEGAKFNQDVITRLRSVPTVRDYDGTTGYTTRSDATTTDVTITINKHKYVSVEFTAAELGSTARDLFGEQSEPQLYALGYQLVSDLLAKVVEGANAFGTSGSQATQIANAAAFNTGTLDTIAGVLDARKVSPMGRFALLDGALWPQLRGDTRLVYLAGFQDRSVIEQYDTMPPVSGFQLFNTPFLPNPTVNSSKAMHGFCGTMDSLALATRLPADYTQALPGAANGVARTITEPDSGLSVMLVQYVNHDLGSAISRVSLMYGAAVGNKLTGQLIAY